MPDVSGLMRGKRGLVMGVANRRSLGWGIAKACRAHGAELAFTYQGEALKKRVEPLAQEVGGIVVGDCDVAEPATIDAVFAAVQSAWGGLDFLVHAIAFSDRDQLDGDGDRAAPGLSLGRPEHGLATRQLDSVLLDPDRAVEDIHPRATQPCQLSEAKRAEGP